MNLTEPRPSEPISITVDTNVFVSGTTISATPPSQIIQAWHAGSVGVALSEPMLAEIHDVFFRPFFRERTGWATDQIEEYMNNIRTAAIVVPGTTLVNVCRDPKDNMVFSCAVEAKVAYIVSGDDDVLAVQSYQGIPTMSPRVFVDQVLRLKKAA